MGIFSGGGGGSGGIGQEIGYDAISAPVTVASTNEAAATTVISCAAHTFDGGVVLATFFAPYIATDAVQGHTLFIHLWEGATEIGRIANIITPANVANLMACTAVYRFTPSGGSHTYTVKGHMSAGSGSVFAGTGGVATNVAAFIRFTKA